MMALMTSGPSSAAFANASADHSYHDSSCVAISSRTLLSTRVAVKVCGRARGTHDPDRAPLNDEFHLGVRQKAEPLPDASGDRHLALGRDPHRPTLLLRKR